jgi:glutamyl/glutaminyl-tRNA synthetase
MITRIAPTPSGYLHAGNCVNFQLISWFAEAHGLDVALRIDDMDAARYRRQYAQDVFRILQWLEIPWQLGPRDVMSFERTHRLSARRNHYLETLMDRRGDSLVLYACTCSRSDLRAIGARSCDCRSRGRQYRAGSTAMRAYVPPGTAIRIGGAVVDLAAAMGDFVVWRRNDQPSYHLASVVEDYELATTHVIRGRDLIDSTAAQIFLANGLGMASVAQAEYVHHDLVTDADGRKLSKSQLSDGPLATSDQEVQRIRALATRLAPEIDVTPP